jgi:hypothetical protein
MFDWFRAQVRKLLKALQEPQRHVPRDITGDVEPMVYDELEITPTEADNRIYSIVHIHAPKDEAGMPPQDNGILGHTFGTAPEPPVVNHPEATCLEPTPGSMAWMRSHVWQQVAGAEGALVCRRCYREWPA